MQECTSHPYLYDRTRPSTCHGTAPSCITLTQIPKSGYGSKLVIDPYWPCLHWNVNHHGSTKSFHVHLYQLPQPCHGLPIPSRQETHLGRHRLAAGQRCGCPAAAGRRRGAAAAAAAAEDTATGRTGADGWSTMEYSTTRMIVIYCNGLYIYITYAYIIITIMITEFMIMIME